MSDELEVASAVATAAFAASALDGGHFGAHVDHGNCANCGAPLHGSYCSQCGQSAHLHHTLAGVGHDFVHGITHFDGKTWHTLPLLLFKPGKLTREYIDGKRARYVGPVPLFLLVVFLMFFVFSFVHFKPGDQAAQAAARMTPTAAAQAAAASDTSIASLDRDIAGAAKAGNKAQMNALTAVRAGLVTTRGHLRARAERKDPETIIDTPADLSAFLGQVAKNKDMDVDFGSQTLNQKIRKAITNPDLLLYKVQGKAYKFSFLLVPLSLPWLWLMFARRRDVGMYDHAIFALYSISFMSLLFIIGSLALTLNLNLPSLFTLLIFVAPLLHWYAQLKGTYGLTRAGALWRTLMISIVAPVTLTLYLMIIVAIGLID